MESEIEKEVLVVIDGCYRKKVCFLSGSGSDLRSLEHSIRSQYGEIVGTDSMIVQV